MRVIAFLIFACFLSACGSDRDFADAVPPVREFPTPIAGLPTIEKREVEPLDRKQQKELDATLPPKIREVLEKAEKFEVLGLSSDERKGISWKPDVKVEVPLGGKRARLLNAFYFDASAGPNPSACFIPRHGIRATYRGKTVEVIICFECHVFAVKGDLGEFDGGVYRDGSASRELFEEILAPAR